MPGILGLSSSVPLLLTVFPLQMAKTSVLWNPLIYLCMNTSVMVKSFKSFARLFYDLIDFLYSATLPFGLN